MLHLSEFSHQIWTSQQYFTSCRYCFLTVLLENIWNTMYIHKTNNHFKLRSSQCRNFSDLIGRMECNQIVNFNTLLGKNKLWDPEKFQCYTTLVALFKVPFTSLFLDVKKRRQCSEVRSILRSFITDLFKREAFRLYRDWKKLMINQ